MNRKLSSLLKKSSFLLGAVLLGWAANAQTTTPSDTTHRQGMHHRWGPRNSGDSTMAAKGFHRGPDGSRGGVGGGYGKGGAMAWNRQGRNGWGSAARIHYTPEQRKQVAEINKEYRQKSEDLFKKDNSTLREYKAGLLALQKEKKSRLQALLTQQQKDEMAARRKRMAENMQVMAVARMERLKLHLGLSDDQVAKIKAGQENLRSQVKAIHENDNLLPQQKMEQMKALMAKRNDTYKSVLTPEQFSEFQKMFQHRGRDWQGHPSGGQDRS
ncbi:MAG TPA: hypothetical protein VN824_22995 [Puia sp.]|nr:hypothetical protein [Puia sp.]